MLIKIVKYWYNTCYKLQQVDLTARARMIYALKKAKQSEVDIISLVLIFISVQAQTGLYCILSEKISMYFKLHVASLQFWGLLDVPRKEQL